MFSIENQQVKIADERWLAVPGYEGLYEVSDQGRVRKLVSRNGHPAGMLRPTRRDDGYLIVRLCRDGKSRGWLVHRIVLTAFIGPHPPSIHGAHINSIKGDNRLANLHWCTPKENEADKKPLGLDGVGERNAMAKLTAEIVRSIRAEYRPRSRTRDLNALAKKYGITFQHVSSVVHRKCWKHVA